MFILLFCILFLLVLLAISPDQWNARRAIAKRQAKRRVRPSLL